MNGAESLVKTFLASGLDMCFANPGTSEMHFVAALDSHPEMRCVLCLFEGGATGAADGYYRMAREPAATLLHLAPGFGNGHANLHNAMKARSGIVNVVGDHAARHLRHDAPLKGDLDGVARSVSHWVGRADAPERVAHQGAEAVRAARARSGQVATLILPADSAWGAARRVSTAVEPGERHRPSVEEVEAAARHLSKPGAVLLINHDGLHGAGLEAAGKIAARTGCRLIAPFFSPRISSGAGTVRIERMPYPHTQMIAHLEGTTHIVCVGADRPVTFFAYPDSPSTPEPPGCPVLELAKPEDDVIWTLERMVEALGAGAAEPVRAEYSVPDAPSGALAPDSVAAAIVRTLPDGAIIVNEAITSGRAMPAMLGTAAPHDLLGNCGGAIGQCLPNAVGAGVACPDRRVVALTGDGSAMYTLQSLWTMARERLGVTVVVFANRGYQILRGELANLGVEDHGRNASRLFDIEDPTLDWGAIAKGHGLPALQATNAEALEEALRQANSMSGPVLVEAVM